MLQGFAVAAHKMLSSLAVPGPAWTRVSHRLVRTNMQSNIRDGEHAPSINLLEDTFEAPLGAVGARLLARTFDLLVSTGLAGVGCSGRLDPMA